MPFIHGYFVYKLVRCKDENDLYFWERDCKRFKTLTMFLESIPQLIFTTYCYVCAFYGPIVMESAGSVQILSMIVSLISILKGLYSKHYDFQQRNETTNIILIIKSLLSLFLRVGIKISVVLLSIFLFGINVTLVWLFLISFVLIIPTFVYNIEDPNYAEAEGDDKVIKVP